MPRRSASRRSRAFFTAVRQRMAGARAHVGDQRAEHFLFALEVDVEGAEPDAGALGDVADRGLVVAARAKLLRRRVQQPPQSAPPPLRFRPDRSSSPRSNLNVDSCFIVSDMMPGQDKENRPEKRSDGRKTRGHAERCRRAAQMGRTWPTPMQGAGDPYRSGARLGRPWRFLLATWRSAFGHPPRADADLARPSRLRPRQRAAHHRDSGADDIAAFRRRARSEGRHRAWLVDGRDGALGRRASDRGSARRAHRRRHVPAADQ